MKWLILSCVLIPQMKNFIYLSSISRYCQNLYQKIDQLFYKDPSSEDEFDDTVSQIILSEDEEDEVGLEYQSAIDWSLYSDSEEEDNSSYQTIQVAVEDDETAVENKIAEWVVSCRIPHLHVNSLLRILKTHANLQYLSLDTRTLLKSKRGKLLFMVAGEKGPNEKGPDEKGPAKRTQRKRTLPKRTTFSEK
ncbi:hypothetical protein GHT06_020203 [Daphnia sinensis]|uniref:Uncharacterized protein n=1 Tax=Daphnia sinensis TaxID=1820382 RepID=A0AAD5PRD2_9CRUS|nr:hypothetical protein GHT06_020203 [Daphnia sinensis]